MPVLFSFQQVREDLQRHTAGISDDQVWQRPSGLPSLGFQLWHIGGSVNRLLAYLAGDQLSPEQLQVVAPGIDRRRQLEKFIGSC